MTFPDVLLRDAQNFLDKNGLEEFQIKVRDGSVILLDELSREMKLDFDENKKDYFRKSRLGGQELIIKALAGDKKLKRVLDLSAGLGIDSVFLSMNGFQVTAIERNPILYLLLAQAMESTRRSDISELRFIFSDSKKFLNELPEEHLYECVYFDPMYPEKKKSALPRKEMQIFRRLVGDDTDAKDVLKIVLQKNFIRIVVKRPLKAEPLLPGVKHAFKGNTVRYDLYIREKS